MQVSTPAASDHLLHLYRAEMAHCTRLSSQEEVRALVARIATAIVQGDHGQEKCSKNQLIETHLELVMALAAKQRPYLRRLSFLDLVQEGNIGLLRAVASYDYAHPHGSFTAYARVAIRHALADALFADESVMVSPAIFYRQRQVFQHHSGEQNAFQQYLRGLQPVSLERPFINERGEQQTLLEQLAKRPCSSPDERGEHPSRPR